MKISMKLTELYEFINCRFMDNYIIEWAGIFRYLSAINPEGFSKEQWKKLCSAKLDDSIIDTLFRLLLESNWIEHRDNGYIVSNEMQFQRNFETLNLMTKISKNELEQKLLWSKPVELKVPYKIAKEFRYLTNYIFNLICSAKTRIILFAPYYSSAGMEQLIVSFDNLIKANNSVKIDIIVNDIETRYNKKAMDIVAKLVENNNNYNSLRIFKASFENKNSILFFHAKLLLVDNISGYMGSANFSKGGLAGQLEIGIELSKENTKTLVELIDYLIDKRFLSEVRIATK